MGAGGRVLPPQTDREISADLPGKKRQGKKGKWSRKEGKSKKGSGKIENGMRKRYKSYKMRRGLFFFFFFFFFSFSLFKTTEICFGSTNMGTFYCEKAFHAAGKKIGEMTLPPLKNIPLTPYAPAWIHLK